MELVLGHTSSMEFWRTKRPSAHTRMLLERRCDPTGFRAESPDGEKPRANDLERLERVGFKLHTSPVQLLVPDVSLRVRSAKIACSVFDQRFPTSSFVNVGADVLVASPELCCLLEARSAPFPCLVEVGYEFSGTYRLPPLPGGAMAANQPPLTNVSKLRSFFGRTRGINGIDAARKAVPHIVSGSASPKESELSILASFPGRLGGYAYDQPKLNHPVAISEKVRGRDVASTCRCDLFWPDAKLDVEYDSRLHHAGGEEQAKDSARRTALAYAGILVITVTSEQLHTRAELDKVAQAMAKSMGRRFRPRTKDWELKQIKLRSLLLGDPNRFEHHDPV